MDFEIDPRIERAATPPGAFYSAAGWPRQVERVLGRSWQLVTEPLPAAPGEVRPWTLLPGSLDEPLALTRDEHGTPHCLSNVCTHRGNLVVGCAEHVRQLRCGYHGRRFDLGGRLLSMPGFEGVEGFPSDRDDLPRLPLECWGPLAFTALDAPTPFAAWLGPLAERMDWFALDRLRFDPDTSRDYTIAAHWALYCENYLEGFHIPFVHAGLHRVLDWSAYRTETFDTGSLQIGVADGADDVFELPPGHPDVGKRIAAYYYWLFPNLMLNFYPWGLSINVVEPQGPAQTRVRFLSWVLADARRDRGAGADLHRVELEDEQIVESVQRGLRSRLYARGRYSPEHEAGVHHFHRLLGAALA